MREFFHGWRRRAGVVTLVIACVMFGMWMRTFFYSDFIWLRGTKRGHFISSTLGGILWASQDADREEQPIIECDTDDAITAAAFGTLSKLADDWARGGEADHTITRVFL